MASNSRTSGGNGVVRTPGEPRKPEILYSPVIAIGAISVVGLILAAVAASEVEASPGLTILSVGVLVLTASCLVGGGLGFLFALPRDLSRQSSPEADRPTAGTSEETGVNSTNGETQRTGWANNNLIKVSDWLTTLIVGVSLVQFTEIKAWLGGVGGKVGQAAGFPNEPAQVTFGVALILAGAAFGFLTGYVQTRTTVTRRLAVTTRDVETELRKELAETARSVATMRDDLKDARSATNQLQRRLEETAPIYFSLYRPAPHGFQDAISEINRLMRADPSRRNDAKLWAYLACAHGQRFAYEQDKAEPDPAALQKASDDAYAAIEQCLNIDPDQKHWLQTLWDPNDPGHSTVDNDLTPFYTDAALKERFSRLLG